MASERTGAEAVLWSFMDGWWGPELELFQVLSAGEWAVGIGFCDHCKDTHEGSGATIAEAIQQLIYDQAVTHCDECGNELPAPVPDCTRDRWGNLDPHECEVCYRAAVHEEQRATRGRSV